jgi:hypothetical protein
MNENKCPGSQVPWDCVAIHYRLPSCKSCLTSEQLFWDCLLCRAHLQCMSHETAFFKSVGSVCFWTLWLWVFLFFCEHFHYLVAQKMQTFLWHCVVVFWSWKGACGVPVRTCCVMVWACTGHWKQWKEGVQPPLVAAQLVACSQLGMFVMWKMLSAVIWKRVVRGHATDINIRYHGYLVTKVGNMWIGHVFRLRSFQHEF